MITYQSCPVCRSKNIHIALSAKDYTVSGEIFEIYECGNCSFRFTQHVPEESGIGSYYQSENYISHTDTTRGLINRLYHSVRKRTLQKKLDIIRHYTNIKKGSVLDIGAGTGAFLHTMQQAGWHITGLEPDAETRRRANERYGIVLDSPQKLYTANISPCDAVTLWHVLEHVHDLHGYITQIKKLLKPNGCIFIAVPNYTSYDASVYGEHWAAYDVPRHLYHFSPASMKELLKQHDLKLHKVLPMWYDSFYVSMLSEKYKTGHSGHLKAVFNGLLSNLKAIFNKENCSSLIYIIKKADH